MPTQSIVRERPILFSAPMVRAILEGRKTQTRRVMKSQPYTLRTEGFGYPTKAGGFVSIQSPHCIAECPYGVPGERLWVRETHTFEDAEPVVGGQYQMDCLYHADQKRRTLYECDAPIEMDFLKGVSHWKTRPGIHMHRWSSRITLEITDVRVERLQDISEDDAKAEGALGGCAVCVDSESAECLECAPTCAEAFANIWMGINGEASWRANPWVWALTFRRLA